MKKELLTVGIATTTTFAALAGPGPWSHGPCWGAPPPHHGDWWGHGGEHFWPEFSGGVVGGFLANCFGWGHRTVVVSEASPKTVIVETKPTIVVQSQRLTQADTTVQTETLPANNTSVSTAKDETIVYVDTNGNQRVEGKLLIDAKGNKKFPSSYRVIRVDDLQYQ